jgi:hypothetical protein
VLKRHSAHSEIMPEIQYSARSKLSSRLVAVLNVLQHNCPYVFHRPDADPTESLDDFRRTFSDQRRKVVTTLQNPRILNVNINFRTLRHFKAIMEYHRTKDKLHVMQLGCYLKYRVPKRLTLQQSRCSRRGIGISSRLGRTRRSFFR